MRVGGQMRLPSAGTGGRIIVVALCCVGAALVLDVSTSRNKQSWVRAVSEAVVAPANADRRNRRSTRERAEEDARRAEAAQRRQQLLQQSEALQKRLQNIQQNMVLAHQKRMEALQQQMQAAQQQAQQAPQLPPLNSIANTIPLRLQQFRANHQPTPGAANNSGQGQHNHPLAILRRVQEMRANHQHRPHTAVPSLVAAVRQQVVLQHVMARLRHHHAGPGHSALGHPALLRAGTVGHHHSALLVALARARGPYHFAGHGHNRLHHGHHHQPRQHAIFHRMLDKLARHRRDRWKQPATETAAKAPETKPAVKPTTSGVALQGLGSNTQASTTLANAKLPVVASPTSDPSDTSNKNTDWSISKLGGPKSDDDASGSPGGSPKAKKDDANSSPDPDAKAPKQTGRGAMVNPRAEIMRPHTFVPGEILAFNLSAVGRNKAAELKFKIFEDVHLKELQLNVTRLEATGALDAVTALRVLSEAAPADEYALNRVYVPYRTTAEASPSGAGTNAPPPPPPSSKPVQAKLVPGGGVSLGTGCPAGRCFAQALINWQPQLATCAPDVKIGVIDTERDKSHPAFVGARIVEPDEDIQPEGSIKASTVHGTAVLALLAGNSSSATPGLVPQATFYVQNAFYADSNGNAMSSTLTMLSAFNWMIKKKVHVLNLSFAGPIDPKVHDAIKKLTKAGTVVLAAAGNDKSEEPSYPAAYGEVIAVTAVDRNLAPYAYANRGKHIAVAAPGVDVWTALPNRRAGVQTGTSFAVPFATSVVALNYRAAEFRSNGDPFAPRQRALELLQNSIKPIGGNRSVFGAGLVQAPSQCDPGRSPAVAAVTPRVADGWDGKVEFAAPPAPVVEGWPITVHSVANKK